MSKIEILAEKKGKELIYDREIFKSILSKFKDGTIIITLSTKEYAKEFKQRTALENRYYWGVVIKYACNCFSECDGIAYAPEEAHERLKIELNYKYVERTSQRTGEIVSERVAISTINLSTMEFEKYLEKCRLFLNEWFGVYIPLPNENINEYL